MDEVPRSDVTKFSPNDEKKSITLTCQSIYIGILKCESEKTVKITSKGIQITAPTLSDKDARVELNIMHSEIVKVTVHFGYKLNVLFVHTTPICSRYIVSQLQTVTSSESTFYSPIDRNFSKKKIILLIDHLSGANERMIKAIYKLPILEEIFHRDANDILVNSIGKDYASTDPTPNQSEKILSYPPGQRGLTVSIDDYIRLGSDNYLNDVLIEFYLAYLQRNVLTENQRNKTHIFSPFFYNRLTTPNSGDSPFSSAANKRHSGVASWTKSVDLFEKDFIIIPINKGEHWFLAIICFPHPEQKTRKDQSANQSVFSQIDGDSDEEEASKSPCILIFDSLYEKSRTNIFSTIRSYLVSEYQAKYPDKTQNPFKKENMFECILEVPQQDNLSDCGLFLLQFVEQFFKDPITEFKAPMKSLKKWFHPSVASNKRKEIAELIERLMKEAEPTRELVLPELDFTPINLNSREDSYGEKNYLMTDDEDTDFV